MLPALEAVREHAVRRGGREPARTAPTLIMPSHDTSPPSHMQQIENSTGVAACCLQTKRGALGEQASSSAGGSCCSAAAKLGCYAGCMQMRALARRLLIHGTGTELLLGCCVRGARAFNQLVPQSSYKPCTDTRSTGTPSRQQSLLLAGGQGTHLHSVGWGLALVEGRLATDGAGPKLLRQLPCLLLNLHQLLLGALQACRSAACLASSGTPVAG